MIVLCYSTRDTGKVRQKRKERKFFKLTVTEHTDLK